MAAESRNITCGEKRLCIVLCIVDRAIKILSQEDTQCIEKWDANKSTTFPVNKNKREQGRRKAAAWSTEPIFSFADNIEIHIEHNIQILSHHDHLNCDFKSLSEISSNFSDESLNPCGS